MSETPDVSSADNSARDYSFRFSRRAALSVAGLAGVAAVAAACSSKGAASTPSGSSSGTTLGKTSDIPVGGGVVYADQQVVVTQPTAGTFDGFSAICPHMGCTVGGVMQGMIVCFCHNSTFNMSTGAVINGPAQTGLKPAKIEVSGTDIVLSS